MYPLPAPFGHVLAFLFGAVIGSFLNVVIYRLPLGKNLSHPASHCPKCNRAIRPWENIPLISYIMLGRRCAGCKQPISARYFGVEFLTGLMFLAIEWKLGANAITVCVCLFSAALIAGFFIDIEHYIMPDELNDFGLVCGIVLAFIQFANHPSDALMWGWMPRILFNGVICAGFFVFIQLLGFVLFRKEAMGDGDVKLARAIGFILPLGPAIVSFLLAVCVGAITGIGKMIIDRNSPSMESSETLEDETDELPVTLGFLARNGLMYMIFVDVLFRLIARIRGVKSSALVAETLEDEFEVGPRHLPFIPFMVIGFFLSLFWGDSIIRWYLHFIGWQPQ